MKILKFLLPALLAFCFTGCLDIYENVNVKGDGSGTLAIDMDMSQMIEMLQTYMTKDDLAKKGMDKMDTTILMKDIMDTVSTLSPEKKALLRGGSVHIQLDIDAKIFKTHMLFPFSSQSDLQQLYATMSDGSLGSAQLLKGMVPGGQEQTLGGGPSPDINQFNGIYDYTIRDGFMSRKLNADRWKALQANPQLAQVKQASTMGLDIAYTTTISLPRPVKKVDNPLAKLSDDKKTVTMKYNVMDIFDHPEQFAYAIEY
jgi:hypothetical protein